MTDGLRKGIALFYVLCVLDVIFSLMAASLGVNELNPVMRYFMDHGVAWFVMAKLGMDVAGMTILTMAGYRARPLIMLAILVMVGLVVYEAANLAVIGFMFHTFRFG